MKTGRNFGVVEFVDGEVPGTVRAKCVSMNTGKATWLTTDSDVVERFQRWNTSRKVLIQDIFPELDEDTRELLMTGVSPEEWDEIFLTDEDDDFDPYDDTWSDEAF